MVGGRFGEHIRRVANQDAALGGRGHVDVIVADGDIGDHFQIGRSVQYGRIHPIRQQTNQTLGRANGRLQFSGTHRLGFITIGHLMPRLAQGSHARLANMLCYKNFCHLEILKMGR